MSSKYKSIQIEGDVDVKLFLLTKLNYDTAKFPDEMITKMLLLNGFISIEEFSLFIKWMKQLCALINKNPIYSQAGIELAL